MTRIKWLLCSAAVIVVVSATSARAQSAATPAKDNNRLEEVVVTAQRRSERLQRVPIAVTAVGAVTLKRSVITDVTDLAAVVPGLNINNEIGFITTQLRGVGSNHVELGFENPVATYLDGVYIAQPTASLLDLSDIARVEVLKGPQGTLFGRNATGGLINILTKDPTPNFSGAVNVSYENYNAVRTDAYLTGALTDKIAASITLHGSTQGEGWGKNLFDGTDVDKNYHDLGFRSKVKYVSGDTKVLLTGDYSNYRNSFNAQELLPGTNSGYLGGPANNSGRYNVDTNTPQFVRGYAWGTSLQVDHDLGFAQVKSITGYRNSTLFDSVDVDELPLPAVGLQFEQRDWQFSQEVQLLSNSTSRLNWVTGLFYYDSYGKWDPFDIVLGPPNPVPVPISVSSHDEVGTKSYAAYAQGTYDLGYHTKLTLGGRFTHEERTREGVQSTTAAESGSITVAPGIVIPIMEGEELAPRAVFPLSYLVYNRFTFRASLDHQFTDDVLGYVSFNRGFKSGGFNPAVYGQDLVVGSPTYAPEKLDATEVGLKTSLFGGRVRVNVAGFYYDYGSLQLPFVIQTTTLTLNGGKAEIYGTDGDFEARMTDALRVTGGFQAIHDSYISFPLAPLGTVQGGVPVVSGSAAGHHLNFVPSLTLNGGADYMFEDVLHGSVDVATNLEYSGVFYTEPDNLHSQKPFVLWNASATWEGPHGISLTLYGKNLSNIRHIASVQQNSNGDLPTAWAAPRIYGATLGYRF